MKQHVQLPRLAVTALLVAIAAPVSSAQYAERPNLVGSGRKAVDVSGRSVKNQRVRAVHSDDHSLPGTSAWFIRRDPFLAYQLGRNLNFREFRERDGVFDATVSGLAGPMPDGTTAKITANNQTSCVACHNIPEGNPGGGANFSKDSGLGRNTPHYYGAGIVEMLAIQIRTEILLQADTDRSGWISAAEASSAGDALVEPTPGATPINFGDCALDGGTTGSPSFNNIIRVWYVDAAGRHVPGATKVDGVTTFGYNFELVIWGWGQGQTTRTRPTETDPTTVGRAALNPTNRAFLWDPYKTHGGLDSHDPSTTNDPDGDGVSEPTVSGAIQFPVTHRPSDRGIDLDELGFSRDDPDGDGHLTEISEGDLDLAEWFMLNAPRPAFRGTAEEWEQGVALMDSMRCTKCHVVDWEIKARDRDFTGDRRVFDLDLTWSSERERWEGELVRLYREVGHQFRPNYGAFRVRGLFSDLVHHNMGERFAETDFSGHVNRVWRTPPLWGVGSGFPWGHDGHSLTLEDVIHRHGGEGTVSRNLWSAASEADRRTVLDFLRDLQLYDIENTPADIDGDGTISEHFMVQGQDTGVERFNAEWLFNIPVRIQGLVAVRSGDVVTSFAATNIDQAYGQNLEYRRDRDSDGWPDVWDHAPDQTGYKDGVK